MPKFLRRTWYKYSKLGKGRKNKQKWKKPTGRDNKLREKRKNRGAVVSIGYKQPEKERKEIFIVNTIADFEKIQKNNLMVLGKVGKKKKIEIIKKAQEKGLKFYNLKDANKFLESTKKEKVNDKKEESKKKDKSEKEKQEKSEDKPENKPQGDKK